MPALPQSRDELVSIMLKLQGEVDRLGRDLVEALDRNNRLVDEVAKLRIELAKVRT